MEVSMGEELDVDPVATEVAKTEPKWEARPPQERRHFEFDIPPGVRVSGLNDVKNIVGVR